MPSFIIIHIILTLCINNRGLARALKAQRVGGAVINFIGYLKEKRSKRGKNPHLMATKIQVVYRRRSTKKKDIIL